MNCQVDSRYSAKMRRSKIKWIVKVSLLVFLTLLIIRWISSKPKPEKLIRSRNVVDVESELQKDQNEQLQRRRAQVVAPANAEKKDWHDYLAMYRDSLRVGLGEQGDVAELEDESQRDAENRLSLEFGFNALLSDSISVNRSINDIRHKDCFRKKYLTKLPTVSVIIIFWNEYLSVLKRSVHSLINRSPPELLKEIILVDDFSDHDDLGHDLDAYIRDHFKIVSVVRLRSRTGLIGARLAGARKATGEVLLFLDSHVEANYNWLPPLLEPIAINKRTATCPFIDVIEHSNFQYNAQDEGARGAFDWEFFYKRLPLLNESLKHPADPFESPVMAGGLFAISTEFFWELGGYDEGLDIWGGEQYELSFKIWMCGGQMFDIPCSRIGHIYRGPRNHLPSPRKGDYLHRNYKRVAEVWMDEYKDYLYSHGDGIYEQVDAGDLTAQKAIRRKLKCKSFKWFMEKVAFDLVKSYPPIDPPSYAMGALQNLGIRLLCLDTMGGKMNDRMGVYNCADNLQAPQKTQFWELTWRGELRLRRKSACLYVEIPDANAPVRLWQCHAQGVDQYWFYDYQSKMLKHNDGSRCLELLPFPQEVVVNNCDPRNPYMRWIFGTFNQTVLDRYQKEFTLHF